VLVLRMGGRFLELLVVHGLESLLLNGLVCGMFPDWRNLADFSAFDAWKHKKDKSS